MSGTTTRDWKARLTEHIRASGGRITAPRMRVAEIFFRMKGHPGVEELAAEVHKRYKGIGYATVYRTMKLLVESGLVAAREFTGEGFARYEAQTGDGHHDHLICTCCGRIEEFEDPAIESMQARVSERHGFQMEHHRMEIYGVCAECQATQAGGKPCRHKPARRGRTPAAPAEGSRADT